MLTSIPRSPTNGTAAIADGQPSELEFTVKIAALHGLSGEQATEATFQGEHPMDIHRAEMTAMFESFLGDSYDPRKLNLVLDLQAQMHARQATLQTLWLESSMDDQRYIELFNETARRTFELCEEVLGEVDFERLFGSPLFEVQGYIDPETFAQVHAHRKG